MLWALVITGLMFGADGKLIATQGTLAFVNAADCEKAAVIVRADMSKTNPSATLVIGCVPLEKPVKS